MSITYKNEETTIKIGDVERHVKVQCHPARKGLKLEIKIAKLVVPLMKSGGDAQDGKVSMDLNELAKTLTSIDDERIEKLVLSILAYTHIDSKHVGDPNMFDLVFCGEYGFLVDVIKFVLEANFGSFLVKLGILSPEETNA